MILKRATHAIPSFMVLALASLASSGCERDTSGLPLARGEIEPVVFLDDFGNGVDFQAFLYSKLDAVQIDTEEAYHGTASLRVTVPAPGDPSGGFAGGAFTSQLVRDLTGYDALTFWAKSSKPTLLNTAGLGNDNTGTSLYQAERSQISLTDSSWTKVVIPIPLPEKLGLERGLFFFAEGAEGSEGHIVWFDEVMFEKLGTISNPRPRMASRTVGTFVGSTVSVEGTETVFDVEETDLTIAHFADYFTYISSDENVVAVRDNRIQVVGGGAATITARLGEVDATGTVSVNAVAPPPDSAPLPTHPPADVISLFSNGYDGIPVDTWSPTWDLANVSDLQVDGDDVKAYTNLVYAAIEFTTHLVNATDMTHIHLDAWVPEGVVFKVKLVDFGADGAYRGTGDNADTEHEVILDQGTTPPFTTGSWVPLDIPLGDFTRLASREHLAQLFLSTGNIAFVDNVYFHR